MLDRFHADDPRAPKSWLYVALILAITITTLSDIEEAFCFGESCAGHELGTFFSELAFAFVGAYIFNWLIVERPKAKALKGYYAAAKDNLRGMALLPSDMVRQFCFLARTEDQGFDGADQDTLEEILGSIDWATESQRSDLATVFKRLLRRHEKRYEALVPLLNQFDPAVSVAIANVHAEGITSYLEIFAASPMALDNAAMQQFVAESLVDYQQAGRRLGRTLLEAKHMVEFEPGTVARLQYSGMVEPQAAKTGQ